MKAICVLEAIVRKQDTDPYSIIASYFIENTASVVKCSELPQVSLREKASKVSLFGKLEVFKVDFCVLFVHHPKKKESDSCFLETTKLNSVFFLHNFFLAKTCFMASIGCNKVCYIS
jgi:hypothetical protein